MPSKVIMDKDKLIKGVIWLTCSISIIFTALALYIGFNNQRYGDSTILTIGFMLIPLVFYCAYKGIKLVLDSIFQ